MRDWVTDEETVERIRRVVDALKTLAGDLERLADLLEPDPERPS